MGYFEELGKRLSAASKGAVKKASAFADSAAVNVQINALSREREHLFREIGAAYFAAYGTTPAPELTELCCLAATKTAEIESLRRRLQQFRNKRSCTSCGATCSAHDQFCAACGTPIQTEKQASPLSQSEPIEQLPSDDK